MYTAPPLRAHGNVQVPPVHTFHQHTERSRNREKREDQYAIPLRSCHYNLSSAFPGQRLLFVAETKKEKDQSAAASRAPGGDEALFTSPLGHGPAPGTRRPHASGAALFAPDTPQERTVCVMETHRPGAAKTASPPCFRAEGGQCHSVQWLLVSLSQARESQVASGHL